MWLPLEQSFLLSGTCGVYISGVPINETCPRNKHLNKAQPCARRGRIYPDSYPQFFLHASDLRTKSPNVTRMNQNRLFSSCVSFIIPRLFLRGPFPALSPRSVYDLLTQESRPPTSNPPPSLTPSAVFLF